MRTSDETFFNLKRLHLVFAVSSAALLAVSVWMVAADHWRPWREYQRTFRDRIEPWTTEARIRDQKQAGHASEVERLERQLARQEPSLAKRLLGLPLVDCLARPLEIEQIWLPELSIDYSFRQVARFDRCTTCHQGIDKTSYRREQTLTLQLPAPAGAGQGGDLEKLYGFALAERGMLGDSQPTVGLVLPRSPAARAGLEMGDVLLSIGGGKPLSMEVRRGLGHPYAAHPRPDLFVGTHSPHPAADFGCTICHDGQGSATDFTFAAHAPNGPEQRLEWRRRYGWFANEHWDFPMLPARLAESRCLKCHHEVSDLEPSRRFPDPPAPKLLAGYNLVRQLGCFGCHEIKGFDDSGRSVGPDLRLEPKGALRKVGPALRDVGGRLDAAFLADHTADPARFRPTTRMPRLFGLHEHLEGPTLDQTRRLEAVEIRAVTEYLLAASQPSKLTPAPAGITESPSAERGKRLFQVQGCLGCHKHEAFPAGQSVTGPDLSRLGAKYKSPASRAWLVSWLRNPVHHSPRTKMPSPVLEPVALEAGQGRGGKLRVSDPAADLAAWLVTSAGWEPKPLAPVAAADVDQLARMYPEAEKGDSPLLCEAPSGPFRQKGTVPFSQLSAEKKLQQLGRRTIRKRGCYGCHDIAGFEDAQPIAPSLADWGRKQLSLLTFEQINQFVERRAPGVSPGVVSDGLEHPRADARGSPDGFFREALLSHRREGFIWQKLGAPRSFDYKKAAAKSFNEQLLMGRFTLSDPEREAIITFVLGLVAQPPAGRYVYQPDPRRRAIVEGRKVIDQYGCAECHTIELERWTLDYDPAKFFGPPAAPDYAFLKPHVSDAVLAASREADRRGLARVELAGMPRVDPKGNLQEGEDDEGNPVYAFSLWEPAAIGGRVWTVGGPDVLVPKSQLIARRPPLGGNFARLLYPLALAEARAAGTSASEAEAWGWVPPALAEIGRAVQPQWMYEYLLAPRVIRPAAVLRMPKFNLSPAEARKLADYFAAVGGAEFPYAVQAGSPPGSAAEEQARLARCDRAMKFLLDRKTYCAKCHLVGDYGPGGDNRTVLAPALDQVGRRIRPEYLRRWLANPKSALPYTAMPVNFPPAGEALGQDFYRGPSLAQLDAVMELLLNYDWYLGRRHSVRRMAEEK